MCSDESCGLRRCEPTAASPAITKRPDVQGAVGAETPSGSADSLDQPWNGPEVQWVDDALGEFGECACGPRAVDDSDRIFKPFP